MLVRKSQGYETITLLVLLMHPDYLITTCLRPNPILGEFEHGVVSATLPSGKRGSCSRYYSEWRPSICATWPHRPREKPTKWSANSIRL